MVWAPLVGVLVALIAAFPAVLLSTIGAPPLLVAFVAVATSVYLTRGLHEDGLADFADGLGGGWTRERRLEIMKDSQIGTFGTLALVLSIGMRVAVIAALLGWGAAAAVSALVASAGLSRVGLPAILYALPPARADGLSHGAGRPSLRSVGMALVLGVVVLFAICPWPNAIVALLGGMAGFAVVRWMAATALGGQTGDVAGTAQQVIETIVLISLCLELPV